MQAQEEMLQARQLLDPSESTLEAIHAAEETLKKAVATIKSVTKDIQGLSPELKRSFITVVIPPAEAGIKMTESLIREAKNLLEKAQRS